MQGKVRLELTEGYTDKSGDPIKGLGLAAAQVDRIEQFLAIKSKDRKEVFTQLYELFSDIKNAEEEIGAVEKISNQLYLLGYDNDRTVFDLSVARGLAYYTGPVFEAVLLEIARQRSLLDLVRHEATLIERAVRFNQ